MWMHPGRVGRHSKGDNKCLLKIRGKSYRRPVWAKSEAEAEREPLLYPGAFKSCANLWEGKNLGGS